ncbi:hypothetical protein GCM10023238_32000 [Streptomyces heliomycini]
MPVAAMRAAVAAAVSGVVRVRAGAAWRRASRAAVRARRRGTSTPGGAAVEALHQVEDPVDGVVEDGASRGSRAVPKTRSWRQRPSTTARARPRGPGSAVVRIRWARPSRSRGRGFGSAEDGVEEEGGGGPGVGGCTGVAEAAGEEGCGGLVGAAP